MPAVLALGNDEEERSALTSARGEGSFVGMKSQLIDMPLDVLLQTAQRAGQKAAAKTVAAGRCVAGWKDGKLVEYGPGAMPLPPAKTEQEEPLHAALQQIVANQEPLGEPFATILNENRWNLYDGDGDDEKPPIEP